MSDPTTIIPTPRNFISKGKEARTALQAMAREAVDGYFATILAAKNGGDYEAALKALQWYFEHVPAEEGEERVIDTSIDKPKPTEGYKGPTINFGFQMGGLAPVSTAPELPTIDVKQIPVATDSDTPTA